MMEDDFAFPNTVYHRSTQYHDPEKFLMGGMTKREMMAIHILSGLSVMAIPGSHNMTEKQCEELPIKAVKLADRLMLELRK